MSRLISDKFKEWERECDDRFDRLKANEEELNRLFIGIYGLQDELSPDVEDRNVTVRKADLQREIKSLLSYAVGCYMGRFSLDTEGLVYAGGEWDSSKYRTITPVDDGLIPICDDDYLEGDMLTLIVDFVRKVYGDDTLEENLRFIADALGGKGTPCEVIRSYMLGGFFADHCKIYRKRPIYWLFDAGKKNSCKVLMYLHRCRPDTVAKLRTDYVHELRERYRSQIAAVELQLTSALPSDRTKLTKQLTKLRGQSDEINVFEEKVHHIADMMIELDLDDGVRANYEKFGDILAKIK